MAHQTYASARQRTLVLSLLSLAAALPSSLTAGGTGRELRYRPEGVDFVIENGGEFFNRALYGGNSGFRAEAGDRPEFALYLPGRGGNLRIGISKGSEAKWLFDAKHITARYRAGSMVYEIRDPLLGDGTLTLTAIPMAGTEGLVLRAGSSQGSDPLKLIWAFGGANGDKGRRNGDLRGETVPLSRFFQIKPEYCTGNTIRIQPDGFTLTAGKDVISGLTPPGAKLAVADAVQWASPAGLVASAGKRTKTPVLVGEAALTSQAPLYLGLRRIKEGPPAISKKENLPGLFEAAEKYRQDLAGRLGVETPDPFINAAASAISVAADAVWDEKSGAYMHGAIAWRTRLLGWRGPYAGDVLGWHDRTRRHFSGFAAKQNTSPVPPALAPADEKSNLSRNPVSLHSNGDMGDSQGGTNHYDMNLVAVDAFFRHLMWTGDLVYAAKMWPVIERHLAWERRLFRRPSGSEKLPLYEAYCCIWASDELFYNGGGATHSTAYNYWHNLMAARVAKAIGKDPAPYEKEAALIHRAMQSELWLPDRGWFAEFKDILGGQAVHPDAALWTFYHTLDSMAATPLEAWQMSRFLETRIPHIPMRGPGVPEGNFTVATTDWMPYMWSINNVALEESAHGALGCWQAGRGDIAFPLLKGCLLDSMFMGTSPGNVGMTTLSDAFSNETYRDFADSVGASARTIVEGLFGIMPDHLAGQLRVRPGFPAAWDSARIHNPDISYAFRRNGLNESHVVESRQPAPMALLLEIPALRDRVASVMVNGKPCKWRALPDSVGTPRIVIAAPAAARNEVLVQWQGEKPEPPEAPGMRAQGETFTVRTGSAKAVEIEDPQQVLKQARIINDGVEATAQGTPGHRTAFIRVTQGDLTWWRPVAFELRATCEIVASPVQDPANLRFRIRNNTPADLKSPAIQVAGKSIQRNPLVKARGESEEIVIPADGLSPGSNVVSLDSGNGVKADGLVVNWKIKADGRNTKMESVDLTKSFNDKVTRIFLNEYRSPRSPFCSLAIPKQGIGGWCHFETTAEIDDSGLRSTAARNGGNINTPFGVPFRTPSEANAGNIAFTSQWDNYPKETTVPLTGTASHAYLLMAGSLGPMQCRFDNGEIVVTYADGSTGRLVLQSPENWWPVELDYFIDEHAFARPGPVPPRIDLKTGDVRVRDSVDFKRKNANIPGGAATVLDLPLDPAKELKSITLRTLGNEVVIGMMALTLARNSN